MQIKKNEIISAYMHGKVDISINNIGILSNEKVFGSSVIGCS